MYSQRIRTLIGVVLDSSVSLAAHLSSRGASAKILKLWRAGKFQLITSPDIITETARVLSEHGVEKEIVEDYITSLYLLAFVTDGLYMVDFIKEDSSDNIFLAAGLEGEADFIVSLDNHLLSIKHYHNIQIVSPKGFLRRLRSLSENC